MILQSQWKWHANCQENPRFWPIFMLRAWWESKFPWMVQTYWHARWHQMAEGDFNLMCYPKHRNEDGGNINEILGFNNAISRLSLVEIPLKGCKYTWTNCQPSPLLERLEWFFFLSNSWIIAFPNTVASTLSRDTADHTPCLISATTRVPRLRFSGLKIIC